MTQNSDSAPRTVEERRAEFERKVVVTARRIEQRVQEGHDILALSDAAQLHGFVQGWLEAKEWGWDK